MREENCPDVLVYLQARQGVEIACGQDASDAATIIELSSGGVDCEAAFEMLETEAWSMERFGKAALNGAEYCRWVRDCAKAEMTCDDGSVQGMLPMWQEKVVISEQSDPVDVALTVPLEIGSEGSLQDELDFTKPVPEPSKPEREPVVRRQPKPRSRPAPPRPAHYVPPAPQYHVSDKGEGVLAWQVGVPCAQTDPEAFFPEKGSSTREAKKVCADCEVRKKCLDYALGNDERFGIWGGLSPQERRKLTKTHNKK